MNIFGLANKGPHKRKRRVIDFDGGFARHRNVVVMQMDNVMDCGRTSNLETQTLGVDDMQYIIASKRDNMLGLRKNNYRRRTFVRQPNMGRGSTPCVDFVISQEEYNSLLNRKRVRNDTGHTKLAKIFPLFVQNG